MSPSGPPETVRLTLLPSTGDSIYRSSRPVGAYVMLRVAQAKAYDGNLGEAASLKGGGRRSSTGNQPSSDVVSEEEMKKQLVQRRAALDHKANAFL